MHKQHVIMHINARFQEAQIFARSSKSSQIALSLSLVETDLSFCHQGNRLYCKWLGIRMNKDALYRQSESHIYSSDLNCTD